jgi:hypothetical protein
MRKSTFFAFAFSAVFATSSLYGQTTSAYPWRSNSLVQPTADPDTRSDQTLRQRPSAGVRLASSTTNVFSGSAAEPAPAPPAMKRRPFLASFRKKQDEGLGDTQPSVSDVQQLTFDPPVAPTAAVVAPGDQQPPLIVPSNALNEPAVNYCDRNCKPGTCNLGCEKKLFGKSARGLEMGGWASLGYHNRNNPLLNNRKAEANLHQAWLFAEKAASRDCDSWDIGFRTDLLYGIDGQDLQAFGNAPNGAPAGWDNSWDYGSYGWALPQAYVQFANADWDVKVGKFFSPFGYEVIGAKDNFFYSHTYTMFNTEPFTMSGILAERRVSDTRSVIIGATAGWDTAFENNSGGNLITGTRLRPNEFFELALTSSIGDTGIRGTGTMSSAVAQFQLTGDLKYVFQADVLNLEDNQEFGIVHYLFRDVSDCLALGARLEWWKSDQFFPNTKSTYDFTVGANYRVNSNITVRPELRWDWGAGAVDPGATIFGIDAVMTF